ncbi:MAG: DUF2975 domain-containing protein [Balneolaceae bacterium]|nr:DUF2975 domain-containing protein [Balneolaceae bacterium]
MKLKNDWTLAHLLYYLSWYGAGLIALGIILTVLFSLLLGHPSPVLGEISVRVQIESIKGATEVIDAQSSLFIRNPADAMFFVQSDSWDFSPVILLLYVLEHIKLVAMAIVLYLFSKIFKSIIDQVPFHEKNPFYLFCIGWIFFLSSTLDFILNQFIESSLKTLSIEAGYQITGVQVFGDYMILGIFMIVIGYVFKEGNRLKKEQELTI